MSKISRKIYNFSRLLHIYLSTLLLGLLLMFCVTGIVLNHPSWLENSYTDKDRTLINSPEIIQSLNDNSEQNWQTLVPKAQALIEQQLPNLNQPKTITVDQEVVEILFDYQLPASYTLVVFNTDGITVEYRQSHWLSIMNDLHKGRHSGATWSWVIDVSAALIVLFAITGMIILFQNRKRRTAGLILTVLGLFTPFLIYWAFVPRI